MLEVDQEGLVKEVKRLEKLMQDKGKLELIMT